MVLSVGSPEVGMMALESMRLLFSKNCILNIVTGSQRDWRLRRVR